MKTWVPRTLAADIMKAVKAKDRSTHVFYITSGGGEGKTVLLQQIGQALGSEDGIQPNFPWSGILDLYHSEVNTNSGLERRLSDAFETNREFEKYLAEREVFQMQRDEGLLGPELESERTKLAKLFAEGMNKVTDVARIVIAFDTVERLQYKADLIQTLCNLESETTIVRSWLLQQLVSWKNCVVLLVGRPSAEPAIGTLLDEALRDRPNVYFEHRRLGGFDWDEARQYFEQKREYVPALADLGAKFRERLWEVTEGAPIRLDLASEVIQHQLGFDAFQKEIEESSAKVVRKEVDRLLIEHVMNDESNSATRRILRYLMVARKGLDASLLHHLAGPAWDITECQKQLDGIAKREFIKRYADGPQSKRLFLHDEMYALCDEHLLQPEEVQGYCKHIVEWYEAKIEAAEDKETREDLLVDSLLYRLRADPLDGYRWYAEHVDVAIRALEIGFDMRMRNEVLAFMQSDSEIDKKLRENTPDLEQEFNSDAAPHWVKRLVVRGENARAIEIADTIWENYQYLCPIGFTICGLTWADLKVHEALAAIYSGRVKVALPLLKDVIQDLQGDQRSELLAPQDANTYLGRRRNLLLGRAHNHLGYAYWMHEGHLHAALKEFRAALLYFRASDLGEERANTSDNMGRVYAILRHPTRAMTLVDEGRELREALERDYRVALSLISKALVHLEFRESTSSQRLAQDALNICERLGAKRGIGLSLIVLGRALRDMGGRRAEYGDSECERYFRESDAYLQRAVDIFTDVDEPVRLVEAYNELGATRRDWATLAKELQPGRQTFKSLAYTAIQYFDESIKLAEQYDLPVWYVDSCEDRAQVHFLREEYKEAENWLLKAAERVPAPYKIKAGEELADIPDDQCVEMFWLQSGKIELRWGNFTFDIAMATTKQRPDREILKDMITHYLFSVAYFSKFSERAVGLGVTFRQMYDHLRDCPLEDLIYLQEQVPDIAQQYKIDLRRLGRFFEDTLGLAIEPPV